MGDYGMRVSKPGIDVNTADPKDLSYSSGFNSLKIAQSGNKTSEGVTVTIDHSLGYTPVYLAYVEYVSLGLEGYRMLSDINSYATDTQLILGNGLLDVGDKVSYFIFYDPADTGVTDYTRTKTNQWGMKISQTGEDVHTVTDTDTSFLSEYNTLQIREILTSAGATAGNSVAVTHNYGYPPAFMAQVKRTTGGVDYYEPLPYIVDAGAAYDTIVCASKDNTIDIISGDEDHDSDAEIRIVVFTESLE